MNTKSKVNIWWLAIAGKSIDTQNISDPVVGFIFNSSGLMANLTLEGTRFTRISR